MASDEHVAAALGNFAKAVMRNASTGLGRDDLLSREENDARRRRLQDLAAGAEALAASPRTATYQAFDRILIEAQQLGAQIERETIIAVARAFMQRPHVVSIERTQRE